MLLTRLDLRAQDGPMEPLLPKPAGGGADVSNAVAQILAEVKDRGDEALISFTKKFDGVELAALAVPRDVSKKALQSISKELREALELAWDRIVSYHSHEGTPPRDFENAGVTVRHLIRPVDRAGCYAPGGRACYPSTVLMCAAPAKVAGVKEIILCVPPKSDGTIDDATLAAGEIAGMNSIYSIGGAQAIGAMAYGTKTIGAVDVIVGPGNRYVAEAKRQVSGTVGIASGFAGPSEVVVIAGPQTPPKLAAIDLVVQAEHGPDGMAWCVSWTEAVLDAIEKEIDLIVSKSPRKDDLQKTFATNGYGCLVDSPHKALEVSNAVAPEHLELLFDGAEEFLDAVTAAGAVFCGPWSPASLGDYLAGPNHVLPTARTARFASALRPDDFRRHIHAVSATKSALDALGLHVIELAEAEGLVADADSIRYRQ